MKRKLINIKDLNILLKHNKDENELLCPVCNLPLFKDFEDTIEPKYILRCIRPLCKNKEIYSSNYKYNGYHDVINNYDDRIEFGYEEGNRII